MQATPAPMAALRPAVPNSILEEKHFLRASTSPSSTSFCTIETVLGFWEQKREIHSWVEAAEVILSYIHRTAKENYLTLEFLTSLNVRTVGISWQELAPVQTSIGAFAACYAFNVNEARWGNTSAEALMSKVSFSNVTWLVTSNVYLSPWKDLIMLVRWSDTCSCLIPWKPLSVVPWQTKAKRIQ